MSALPVTSLFKVVCASPSTRRWRSAGGGDKSCDPRRLPAIQQFPEDDVVEEAASDGAVRYVKDIVDVEILATIEALGTVIRFRHID
jgi:hypothetical protein